MTTHMIQMYPDMITATRWSRDYNVVSNEGDDFGYAWHALMSAAFGSDAPKPFRVIEKSGRSTSILAYTPKSAEELINIARVEADPTVVKALGIEQMAGKVMPSGFSEGQTFGFEVRIRPTVRSSSNGKQERDAFLVAIEKTPDARVDRGEIYAEWLSNRFEALGAAMLAARAEQIGFQKVMRRGQGVGGSGRKIKLLQGPEAIFTGSLLVKDSEAFNRAIYSGIGRHKAFGYGMLLLKRAA